MKSGLPKTTINLRVSPDIIIATISFLIIILLYIFYQGIYLQSFVLSGIVLGTNKNTTKRSQWLLFCLSYIFLIIDDFFIKSNTQYPRSPYLAFVMISIPFNALLALIPIVITIILKRLKLTQKQ